MSAEPRAVQVRLLYVSRAKGPQTTTVTTSILLQAQVHNQVLGITGLLCQGRGFFFQVLEGGRSEVNALYRRICQDPRHKDVEVLRYEEIGQRRFSQWSMAFVKIPFDDPMFSQQQPEFDPYAVSGDQVMALLNHLIDTGQPITAPTP
jgi:hypothetical protein